MELLNVLASILGILAFLWGISSIIHDNEKYRKLHIFLSLICVCAVLGYLWMKREKKEPTFLPDQAQGLKIETDYIHPNFDAALVVHGFLYSQYERTPLTDSMIVGGPTIFSLYGTLLAETIFHVIDPSEINQFLILSDLSESRGSSELMFPSAIIKFWEPIDFEEDLFPKWLLFKNATKREVEGITLYENKGTFAHSPDYRTLVVSMSEETLLAMLKTQDQSSPLISTLKARKFTEDAGMVLVMTRDSETKQFGFESQLTTQQTDISPQLKRAAGCFELLDQIVINFRPRFTVQKWSEQKDSPWFFSVTLKPENTSDLEEIEELAGLYMDALRIRLKREKSSWEEKPDSPEQKESLATLQSLRDAIRLTRTSAHVRFEVQPFPQVKTWLETLPCELRDDLEKEYQKEMQESK